MSLRVLSASIRCGVGLTALGVLLSACGGGGAVSEVADPAALVVALDLDRYDSFDAVARAAARERGTPGEQERVLVLVHSRRTGEAPRMAERLRSQGLPVRAIDADDALLLRHARS
jgi:hypothetical protein